MKKIIPTDETLHALADQLETTFPMWDGLAAAAIGYADPLGDTGHRLVYSGPKCVKEFIRQGMSPDEAVEYLEHNVSCAYIGKETPVIVWPFPEDILNDTGRKPRG